jgi:hypothetical protein
MKVCAGIWSNWLPGPGGAERDYLPLTFINKLSRAERPGRFEN